MAESECLLYSRTREAENDCLIYSKGGVAESECIIYSRSGETATESIQKNDLDKYLDDAFEHEAKFKTDDKLTHFIQLSVEQTVAEIILFLQTCEVDAIQKETKKLLETFPYLRKSNKHGSKSMLKVGSYYEGTKIGFPDEFDFIFVLGEFESDRHVSSVMRYREDDGFLQNAIINGLSSKSNNMSKERRTKIFEKYSVFDSVNETLHSVYLCSFYRSQRGPSIKLGFHYTNCSGYERNIFVDLVLAFKVYESSSLILSDQKWHYPHGFLEEIADTGSILLVEGQISFSQTEVHFMKNVLSPKHRMVYKIVKYLINGHDCPELILEKLVKFGLKRYNFGLVSSYMIKHVVIFHHFECTYNENKSVADCVITLLETIENIESIKPLYQNGQMCNALRDMILSFEIMKTSFTDKKVSFTPINKTFLEQENNDMQVETPTMSFEIMKTSFTDQQVSFTPINKTFLEQENNDIQVEMPTMSFEFMKTSFTDQQVSFTPINKTFLEQENNDIQVEMPTIDNTAQTEYFQCICLAFRCVSLIIVICMLIFLVSHFVFGLEK